MSLSRVLALGVGLETSRSVLGCGVLACALVGGCAPTPMTDQRRELLQSWGVDLVLPELRAVETGGEKLEQRVSALCDAPSAAALDAARAAWMEARSPWKRFEVFAFGPASERPLQLAPQIDFWPIRPAAIEKALAERTYEGRALLGTQKGFPGIEYLLFGPDAAALSTADATPNSPQAAPSQQDAGAADGQSDAGVDAGMKAQPTDAAVPMPSPLPTRAERCEYLRRMSQALIADAGRLYQAWDPKHDDFLSELTRAGTGSVGFDTLPMALGLIVNRMAFIVSQVRAEKLMLPMGADAAHLELDKLESPFSGRSVADMLDNLDGVERAYFGGKGGLGLEDYLIHRGKAFTPQFQSAMKRARDALLAIDDPLPRALESDRPAVMNALDRLQELQRLIQVDFLGALSLSLQFTDNDGD